MNHNQQHERLNDRNQSNMGQEEKKKQAVDNNSNTDNTKRAKPRDDTTADSRSADQKNTRTNNENRH